MEPITDFSMELKFTETYRALRNAPPAIREARCHQVQFPAVCQEIQAQDLIAGRVVFGHVGFSPHNSPPQSGFGYYCDEVQIIQAIERGNIPLDQREGVWEMLHFWKTENTQTQVEAAFDERMAKHLYRYEIERLPFNFRPTIANPIYRMAGVYPDYEKLLRLGVPGLKQEVANRAAQFQPDSPEASLFEGMGIVIEVFADVCRFYSRQAQEKAQAASDPSRKSDLLELAGVLEHIASRPPQTFYQALQMSVLYAFMTGTLEFGRMDIFLGNFYVHDLEQGILTEERALALMCSFWRLINDLIREVDGRVIIGGCGRPNEANADRFALLVLETTRAFGKAILPQLTLRFYTGMNPALMSKSIQLIGDGFIYPLLYNDDVLVPALANGFDLPVSEVEQYVPLGCGEIVLDHRSFGTPSGNLNTLKALEVTLRDGVDLVTGQRIGLPTGRMEDFKTFDQLMVAYKKQLAYFIEILGDHEELEYMVAGKAAPFLFLSLLYDDCMERGKGMFNGGVRYLGGTMETFGNVNAADSLTAIRSLVFDRKLLSAEQLLETLAHNFVGHEKERRLMLDCPKYGNDDAAADAMMVELHEFLCNTIRDQRQRLHLHNYLMVNINNSQNTTLGRWVGASADGRKAGMALANANTPAGGNDKKGVTALINSIVKPTPALHAGLVQNMRFGRDFFTQDRNLFDALLTTYFQKGGSQAMITVINRGDLERAMVEPEKYKDLFVRVGGFSARFVDLPKDVQVEILSRTTY